MAVDNEVICPYCKKIFIQRRGKKIYEDGTERTQYYCTKCQKWFTRTDWQIIFETYLSKSDIEMICRYILDYVSIREIAKIKTTIIKLKSKLIERKDKETTKFLREIGFTNAQIEQFKDIIERYRGRGKSVPYKRFGVFFYIS